MNPVWSRIPATVIAMDSFRKADYFLYLDSDANLASAYYSPRDMYNILSYDGSGDEATYQHKEPALIVSKPLRGWLCMQCIKYNFGHGCINSGVLLWKRSKEATTILKEWWEARKHDKTQNFFLNPNDTLDGSYKSRFHGWSFPNSIRVRDYEDQQSEQNRLTYLYGTNARVREATWVVPRQKAVNLNTTSCPDAMDAAHFPCLQNDFTFGSRWRWGNFSADKPGCFVAHHAGMEKLSSLNLTQLILRSHQEKQLL